MIKIAGKMFTQYETEIDESNQIIKGYQDYIGDDKIKNVVLNKVSENSKKKFVNSAKTQIHKIFSTNNFNKLLSINKRELQSNK